MMTDVHNTYTQLDPDQKPLGTHTDDIKTVAHLQHCVFIALT